LNVKGEFTDPKQVENIVIRSMSGATIFLKDIANVESGFKEKESYARLDGKNVITLNVIKRSGQNLIDASDKIKVILDDLQANTFPSDLKISVTADQSENTRVTLHDVLYGSNQCHFRRIIGATFMFYCFPNSAIDGLYNEHDCIVLFPFGIRNCSG
jgi:hypothetical protein